MACTPGDQKCIGDNLYECRGHFDLTLHEVVYEWELKERNSPQCVVEPEPEPEPEPELIDGTIIRKELEFSGSGDGAVPVVGVPQGVSAKLHVWGRNDSNTSQPIGIYWFVSDPDGLIVEEYTDWKFGTLGPGQTHEFISSGQFNLDKVGRYGTWIELLMSSPEEIVDRYIGDLCIVVSVVPEYKGTIAKKELEYNDTRKSIPVY